MLGPKGFTALNGLGMLVKGFDHRPALGIPYNHAYYPELMEKLGFKGIRDIASGYLTEAYSYRIRSSLVAEKVQEKRGIGGASVHFSRRPEKNSSVFERPL